MNPFSTLHLTFPTRSFGLASYIYYLPTVSSDHFSSSFFIYIPQVLTLHLYSALLFIQGTSIDIMSMVSHGFGRILRASTKVRGRLFPTPHQTIAIQQEKIPKKKVPIIPYGREFCSTASSAIIMGDRILTGFPRELLIPEPKVPPQRLNKSLMDKIPPTLKKFTLQEKVCVVTG